MTVDVHEGRISVDAGDLRSITSLNAGTPFAVYGSDGSLIAGTPPSSEARGLQTAEVPVTRDDQTLGHVAVWQSDLWIGEFARNAAIVSFGIGLLLIALGAIVSRRVAQRVLAPVGEIASLAERIEAHDLSGRLDADGWDELGRLCASFDRMLDRLQSAFERERRFVADASHELRAPLAVLRAETDLALRRRGTTMNIVPRCLNRARIGAPRGARGRAARGRTRRGGCARQRQTLDAGELVRQLGDRVRPAAATRGINCGWKPLERALAQANRATLERALLAIVHNAIEYGRDDGVVSLRALRNNDASAYRSSRRWTGVYPGTRWHTQPSDFGAAMPRIRGAARGLA